MEKRSFYPSGRVKRKVIKEGIAKTIIFILLSKEKHYLKQGVYMLADLINQLFQEFKKELVEELKTKEFGFTTLRV